MPRLPQDRLRRSRLNNASPAHYVHPGGHVAHQRQIMGDEEDGQVPFGPQPPKKVGEAGLGRLVDCGRGLVRDQDPRFGCQGPGDADPLTLAARKCLGEPSGLGFVDADGLKQGKGLCLGLFARQSAPYLEGFRHRRPRPHPGVEGRIRVLEDHLDLPSLVLGDALSRVGLRDLLAFPQHRSKGRRLEAHEHPRQRGLAAAALANHAHDLTRIEGETGIANGLERVRTPSEPDRDVPALQQRSAHGSHPIRSW